MSTNYLFVGGCARSGTTAMVSLLNLHPTVVIGRERFRWMHGQISPECFEPERFFNPTTTEARFVSSTFYEPLRKRWEKGNVRYIGDKYPRYIRSMRDLRETFEGCKLIMMVRDLEGVASSYKTRSARDDAWSHDYTVAVDDWNRSQRILRRELAEAPADLYPVSYESLFSGDLRHLKSLFAFLGLKVPPKVEAGFLRQTSGWKERRERGSALNDQELEYLHQHGKHGIGKEVSQRIDEALDRWAPLGGQ